MSQPTTGGQPPAEVAGPLRGPSPAPVRYQSLDVLRGIAILGTLATNIWIFTHPEGLIGYFNRTGQDGQPLGWLRAELLLQQLAQGKFLGLLTVLFGIGLEIQRRSAVRSGSPWPGRYPVRAALLLLDGLLHFVLVAEFDVLMGYAVTGVVVAYLLVTSERTQRWVIGLALAVHLVVVSAVTALLLSLPPRGAPAPLEPNPYADGSWWDLVLFRLDNLVLFRIEPVFIFALSVGLFGLGALLLRAGVLDPSGRRLRRRLILAGAVAFAADLWLGLGLDGDGVVASRYGTAPVVALGLLAVVVELVHARPHGGPVRRRLEEVGRTALSCYVLQNIVASTICYGWGLGVSQQLGPAARVPATVAIYGVVVLTVVLAAHLWLRRFSRGPVELAWQWSATALSGGRRSG